MMRQRYLLRRSPTSDLVHAKEPRLEARQSDAGHDVVAIEDVSRLVGLVSRLEMALCDECLKVVTLVLVPDDLDLGALLKAAPLKQLDDPRHGKPPSRCALSKGLDVLIACVLPPYRSTLRSAAFDR
jgi:hypothetical protein